MTDKKLLECLFGHHDYSEELTVDKDGIPGHLCKVCGRSAHYINLLGEKVYREYDEEGNCVYIRWSDGEERWYNEKGACVRVRCSDGKEYRYDE